MNRTDDKIVAKSTVKNWKIPFLTVNLDFLYGYTMQILILNRIGASCRVSNRGADMGKGINRSKRISHGRNQENRITARSEQQFTRSRRHSRSGPGSESRKRCERTSGIPERLPQKALRLRKRLQDAFRKPGRACRLGPVPVRRAPAPPGPRSACPPGPPGPCRPARKESVPARRRPDRVTPASALSRSRPHS